MTPPLPPHRPSVPVNPQPLHVLQFRYPAAVKERIAAIDTLPGGGLPPPSGDPAHVFDTVDGLRLIISRELHPNGKTVVHISASFNGPEIAARPVAELLPWIVTTWQRLADSTATPVLIKVSEGGVPHFIVEQVS